MNKRKTLDKAEARRRRDQLIKSAASAELSLIDAVREMRAISGMTQEEFAHHRGVSARVVKGLELGQGNPTVATLNRIGEFFGLEVGFVPIRRPGVATDPHSSLAPVDLVVMRGDQVDSVQLKNVDLLNDRLKFVEVLSRQLTQFEASTQQLKKAADFHEQLKKIDVLSEQLKKAESLTERLKQFEAVSGRLDAAELLTSRLKAMDESNAKLEKAGLLQDQRKK